MNITQPKRASHTYVQQLDAPANVVFPLLCPVREADWLEGWDPLSVATQSGVAEPDCVFVTAAGPVDAVWYVTRHEPAAGFVEMLKITPGVTACRLTIRVSNAPNGCHAEVAYTHTSLGPDGDAFVAAFTADVYLEFMHNWERRLNHYLQHGTRLCDASS